MKKLYSFIIITCVIIAAGLVYLLMFQKTVAPTGNNNSSNQNQIGIANPASVNCRDKGYQSEIITSSDGSQYGICIFPDQSQCEEWSFYQGKCNLRMFKVNHLSAFA